MRDPAPDSSISPSFNQGSINFLYLQGLPGICRLQRRWNTNSLTNTQWAENQSVKKGPCVGFRPLKLLRLWKTNTWAGWVVWGWGVQKHRLGFRGPPIDKVMWEVLLEWPSPKALLPAATASPLHKIKDSLPLSKCFLESPGWGWEDSGGFGGWRRNRCTFAWPKSEHRGGASHAPIYKVLQVLFQGCPISHLHRSVVTLKWSKSRICESNN